MCVERDGEGREESRYFEKKKWGEIFHIDSWPSRQSGSHHCKLAEAVTWFIGSCGRHEIMFADACLYVRVSEVFSRSQQEVNESALQGFWFSTSGLEAEEEGLEDNTEWHGKEKKKRLWISMGVCLGTPVFICRSQTSGIQLFAKQ